MINAKSELLAVCDKIQRTILCADIMHEKFCDDKQVTFTLKVGYTECEFEQFLKKLDFDYDNGWGTQELFGTVWLTDGTWLDRHEYDGSEFWVQREVPEIPYYLKHKPTHWELV